MKIPVFQRPKLHFSVISANLLSIATGLHAAWASSVLPKLSSEDRMEENPIGRLITSEEATLIGSLFHVGAIATPLLCALSSRRLGRKNTIALTCIPFIVSSIILAFSPNIGSIYAGRIISGFSIGASYSIVPIYMSEIGENSIRGLLGVLVNSFISAGILLGYALGPYLSVMWFSAFCGIIPLVCLICTWGISESPYFYIENNNEDALVSKERAVKVLKELRPGNYSPDNEIEDIVKFVESGKDGRFVDLIYSKSARKALFIICMLLFFQQWTGLNSITIYAETFFLESGGGLKPEISTMIFGATQLIFTFITPIFVDRLGRKPLLIISALGILVSEVALAVYLKLNENSVDVDHLSWMPIVCLLIFIAFQNLGFVVIPAVLCMEMFPQSVRLLAVNMLVIFIWIMSFLTSSTYFPIADALGYSGLFVVYSCFTFVAIFFVTFFVPETKNKSFIEIQGML